MQKPRNAWVHYILAIHKGKEGHWVLIKGVKLCDTYSEGRWQFVCDGPHKGCRIMEVFEVQQGAGRVGVIPQSPTMHAASAVHPVTSRDDRSALQFRIEPVAQAVAEQVEGEHGERDGDAGEHDHPRRGLVEVGATCPTASGPRPASAR